MVPVRRRPSRPWRIARTVCLVIAVLLLVLSVSAVWTVRHSFPQTDGEITLPGLTDEVVVERDAHGVPQIYASTTEDLFYAQGFVQAQDRFFQMDFRRHLTSGTLASMFGEGALETDEVVRTLGWRRVAQEELALVTPETRRLLGAYSSGVNAYLADRSGSALSLEYAALGLQGGDTTPAPWTPVDSLSWLKAMSWDLGTNAEDEVTRSLLVGHMSSADVAELYPPYPYREHPPIVNQGMVIDGVFEQNATRRATRFPERPDIPVPTMQAARPALARTGHALDAMPDVLGHLDGIGSNAWAVSGSRTATGAPILANDPHLRPSMPGVWYEMGLHCTRVTDACPYDVSGFTFAGLPGVVIGHNDKVAWGFTNMNADVQDLRLEQVYDDNTYLSDGRREPLEVRTETIDVAGRDEPVRLTVRSTRHGPLLSDVSDRYATVGANAPVPYDAPARDTGYGVALEWTALEPTRTADAIFALGRARSWSEFRAAAKLFDVPSQNMVYADRAGNIGYQAPGRIPVRRSGTGLWPSPGWDSSYDWQGRPLPFAALPNVLNPQEGMVVTANQAVTGRDYPNLLGADVDYGYRSTRIRQLLEQGGRDLTVNDMTRIQLDTYSPLAAEMKPLLMDTELPNHYYDAAHRVLARWDCHTDADSPGAAYFNVLWVNLLAATFHDELPASAHPDGGSRWWYVMSRLLRDGNSHWWDDVRTPQVENRDDILRRAMMAARDDLTRVQSLNPHEWEWGRLHRLELVNETLGADTSPVAWMFNRGPYALPGGSSIVNANGYDASQGYAVTAVPSMRMVVPLDNFDDARWIAQGGQSGHAYNGRYTDQTDLWAQGETLPWAYSRDTVDAATEDTLTLKPAS